MQNGIISSEDNTLCWFDRWQQLEFGRVCVGVSLPNRSNLRTLTLCLLLSLPLACLFGQGPPRLEILVRDFSGQAVGGATVELKAETTLPRTAQTDAAGRATFSGLAAGRYTVSASKAGFQR